MPLFHRAALALVAMSAVLGVTEVEAYACGGCFVTPQPPGESPSVVTDHRMVLAIGRNRTTLYDQIRYTGAPSEFAWVLPIVGEVEVGISSDALFAELSALTETTVLAPPNGCPPPDCGGGGGGIGCSTTTSTSGGPIADEPQAPAVVVTKQEVVGPYATVQLQSKDPEALAKWLDENGFALPDESRAIVKQYVAEHFDFLAVKLRPGQAVRAMRPIRVTTPGTGIVLPLRMVAAGAGANVGITLFTVAEGRYEPRNLPFFRIEDVDLEWRWTESVSTYREVRAEKAALFGGKGWEIESSIPIVTGTFPRAPSSPPRSTAADDGYVADERQSASDSRDDDLVRLFDGRTSGATRVTRMRADLVKSALAEDLLLGASFDQTIAPNLRKPTREIGEPSCIVWDGCNNVGTAARSIAIERASSCSTAGSSVPRDVSLVIVAGAVVAAFARRRMRNVSEKTK